MENSAFRAQFHKPAVPVEIFSVLLLKGLSAIISSIDSRWPQELTWLFTFVLLPTTSFLLLPTRCRLHVVLQVHRVPSDAAGATCHSLFVNTQRYASLLSPVLAFCISVYITYTGIASFYPVARATTSADATLYSISLYSASLASRKIVTNRPLIVVAYSKFISAIARCTYIRE